jgi:hypothetical protein
MVGMVVTISPSLSLYKMVVLPAASKPTIRIRISFLPKRPESNLEMERPILAKMRSERLGEREAEKNSCASYLAQPKQDELGMNVLCIRSTIKFLYCMLVGQVLFPLQKKKP